MHLLPPITSRSNARVKALRAALAGRSSAPGDVTAIEGEHLLSEAAQAGVPVETLYVRQGDEDALALPSLQRLSVRERVVLSREVFDAAVDTASPQGLAGTMRIPPASMEAVHEDGPVLLLENVQDPGNVGTLIRSAAAFGAALVVLAGDCANPWAPKVLRSSAGAVFHVPVVRAPLAAAVALLRARRIFAAVPRRAGAVLAADAQLTDPVLMIGNEGRGLTAEALALADELITIPCRVESFNAAVAGSLLLYETFRQAGSEAAQPAAAHAIGPGDCRPGDCEPR